MRMWITTIEEIDTGQTDGDGNPITTQRPRGLDIESGWAQWPVVDDDDAVQVTNGEGDGFVVALAKDLDEAPSHGRDFGDPSLSAFHVDPLPENATDTIEDWISMERGELAGATRAQALRAVTQDQNAALGCTWGPAKVGARVWQPNTEQVRPFRRGADRAWFNGLTAGQRTFIRSLRKWQKGELRSTAVVDRPELLTWYNSLTAANHTFMEGLTPLQRDELLATPVADRNALLQSWA